MVNLVGIDTPLEKKIQNFFQNFLKMVLRYTKNVKKNFHKFEVNILISAEKDII